MGPYRKIVYTMFIEFCCISLENQLLYVRLDKTEKNHDFELLNAKKKYLEKYTYNTQKRHVNSFKTQISNLIKLLKKCIRNE